MPHAASAAHASNDTTTRAIEPGKVVKTVKRHGATFAIDRPIGSVKKGTGFDGKPFELTYSCDYGYLQKTHEDKRPPVGGDGMMVDAYCCEPTTKDGSDSDGDDGTWWQIRADYGDSMAFQAVEGYRAPQWPGQDSPQQMHLDVDVDDLDAGEAAVLELGATKHEHQPGTTFRVFLDPAGHPFCLCQGQPAD